MRMTSWLHRCGPRVWLVRTIGEGSLYNALEKHDFFNAYFMVIDDETLTLKKHQLTPLAYEWNLGSVRSLDNHLVCPKL